MLTVFFSRYISIRERVHIADWNLRNRVYLLLRLHLLERASLCVCLCLCVCVYTARDKTHVMMTAATAVHVVLVVVVDVVVCRRLHVARASQRYGHTHLSISSAHTYT